MILSKEQAQKTAKALAATMSMASINMVVLNDRANFNSITVERDASGEVTIRLYARTIAGGDTEAFADVASFLEAYGIV